MRHAAAALAVVAALAACGTETSPGTGGDTGGGGKSAPVTGVRWVPQSVTVDGRKQTLSAKTGAWVEFHPGTTKDPGGKSGGVAGCNHIGADVAVKGDTVTVSDIVTTDMGCGEAAKFENAFLDVFTGDLKAKVSGNGGSARKLTLTSGDGDTITFGTRSAPALKGTRWTVNSLVENETARSLPKGADKKAHFTLGEDGRVSGSLGCNRFSAKATVKDGRITFGPITSTRMMCSGPQMKTEKAVRAVLSGTVPYQQDHGSLSLTKDSGKGIAATADGG